MKIAEKIDEILEKHGIEINYQYGSIEDVYLLKNNIIGDQIYPFYGDDWLGSKKIEKKDSLYELYLMLNQIKSNSLVEMVNKYAERYQLSQYKGDISFLLKDECVHLLYKNYSIVRLSAYPDESYTSRLKLGDYVYWLFQLIMENPTYITNICFDNKIKWEKFNSALSHFKRYIGCINEMGKCSITSPWIENEFKKNEGKDIIFIGSEF